MNVCFFAVSQIFTLFEEEITELNSWRHIFGFFLANSLQKINHFLPSSCNLMYYTLCLWENTQGEAISKDLVSILLFFKYFSELCQIEHKKLDVYNVLNLSSCHSSYMTRIERVRIAVMALIFMAFAATNSTSGVLFQEVVKNQQHAMRITLSREREGVLLWHTKTTPTPVSALRVANL